MRAVIEKVIRIIVSHGNSTHDILTVCRGVRSLSEMMKSRSISRKLGTPIPMMMRLARSDAVLL